MTPVVKHLRFSHELAPLREENDVFITPQY